MLFALSGILVGLVSLWFCIFLMSRFGWAQISNDQRYFWVRSFGISLIVFIGGCVFFSKAGEIGVLVLTNFYDSLFLSAIQIGVSIFLILESKISPYKIMEGPFDFDRCLLIQSAISGLIFFVFGLISGLVSLLVHIF